jgi:predicted DNA-binding transcriptional regulator AlpA
MPPLLDKTALATLLSMSVAALNKRLPHQLPPRVTLPGSTLARWQRDVVEEWIRSQQSEPVPPPKEEEKPKRPRGRPKKAAVK